MTPGCAILVSMTRIAKSKLTKQPKSRRQMRGRRQPGHWLLQDAKARFSELVRRVRSEGPQHVTVHGRDEVVIIAAEEFRRLKGDLTGQALIAAMQASPHRDIDIEPKRAPMPVREVCRGAPAGGPVAGHTDSIKRQQEALRTCSKRSVSSSR